MKTIGMFSEMRLYADDGSVKDYLVDEVDYDKIKMVEYLESFEHQASCPRAGIDCVTGEPISKSFLVINDGEYEWCDFLSYHISKYNIELPKEFIKKARAEK